MRFRSTVALAGKTATGIAVPAEVIEGLGAGRRVKVHVTINGYAYRSSVAPMGGQFMLPVSAEHRAGAGIAAGDEVDVDLEVDTSPREVAVPPDLAAALADDAQAKRFFEGLSYSQQLWYVTSIEGAKKPETRVKRVADAVAMLRAGRTR